MEVSDSGFLDAAPINMNVLGAVSHAEDVFGVSALDGESSDNVRADAPGACGEDKGSLLGKRGEERFLLL